VDMNESRDNETIDIYYSDSGGTSNVNFSFVTCISIPIPKPPIKVLHYPKVAFSADGSKFAMSINYGRVSVWDIRSKVPLKTFESNIMDLHVVHLQFSSGKLGKETLVFVEVRCSHSDIPTTSEKGGLNP